MGRRRQNDFCHVRGRHDHRKWRRRSFWSIAVVLLLSRNCQQIVSTCSDTPASDRHVNVVTCFSSYSQLKLLESRHFDCHRGWHIITNYDRYRDSFRCLSHSIVQRWFSIRKGREKGCRFNPLTSAAWKIERIFRLRKFIVVKHSQKCLNFNARRKP